MYFQFVLTICLAGVAFAELPSYIHACGRRNSHLSDCVRETVESLQGRLGPGIPELNTPAIEPLFLDNIVISNHSSFNASAENVTLSGFTNFKLEDLDIDLETRIIKIDVFFKEIKLDAEYDVAAKIVVPIAGKGPINIVAEEVRAKVTLKFQLVDHKGAQHVFFPSMTTKLTIKDYTSHFTSREDSDGSLTEGINAALTLSRQEILATIIPTIEKNISERVLPLANGVCTKFTYDELFPDRE